MKRIEHVLAAVVVLVGTSGCVTLFRGFRQEVAFTSDPPGAEVIVGEQVGITPFEMLVWRSSTPAPVKIRTEGREAWQGEMVPAASTGAQFVMYVESLLILPTLFDVATAAAWGWPSEMHAILPEKGQGAATVEVIRDSSKTTEAREKAAAGEAARGPAPACTTNERLSQNPKIRAKCEGR